MFYRVGEIKGAFTLTNTQVSADEVELTKVYFNVDENRLSNFKYETEHLDKTEDDALLLLLRHYVPVATRLL